MWYVTKKTSSVELYYIKFAKVFELLKLDVFNSTEVFGLIFLDTVRFKDQNKWSSLRA